MNANIWYASFLRDQNFDMFKPQVQVYYKHFYDIGDILDNVVLSLLVEGKFIDDYHSEVFRSIMSDFVGKPHVMKEVMEQICLIIKFRWSSNPHTITSIDVYEEVLTNLEKASGNIDKVISGF